MERLEIDDGYYWIKMDGEWEIAQKHTGVWWLIADCHSFKWDDLEALGRKIEPYNPDGLRNV